jgi:hypothetical protein
MLSIEASIPWQRMRTQATLETCSHILAFIVIIGIVQVSLRKVFSQTQQATVHET